MAESLVQVTEGSGKMLHTFQRTIGGNNVEDEVVLIGEQYQSTYQVNTGSAVSAATANSHLLQLMAGATLNVYVRRVQIWQLGLATTAAIGELTIFRLTSAGTGGTVQNAQALDSGDPVPGATAMSLPTVKGAEPGTAIWHGAGGFIQTVGTGGVVPLIVDIDFDRLRGKALKIGAGVANGMAVKILSAIAAATVIVRIEFTEANF